MWGVLITRRTRGTAQQRVSPVSLSLSPCWAITEEQGPPPRGLRVSTGSEWQPTPSNYDSRMAKSAVVCGASCAVCAGLLCLWRYADQAALRCSPQQRPHTQQPRPPARTRTDPPDETPTGLSATGAGGECGAQAASEGRGGHRHRMRVQAWFLGAFPGRCKDSRRSIVALCPGQAERRTERQGGKNVVECGETVVHGNTFFVGASVAPAVLADLEVVLWAQPVAGMCSINRPGALPRSGVAPGRGAGRSRAKTRHTPHLWFLGEVWVCARQWLIHGTPTPRPFPPRGGGLFWGRARRTPKSAEVELWEWKRMCARSGRHPAQTRPGSPRRV